jgi:hypothetical protein
MNCPKPGCSKGEFKKRTVETFLCSVLRDKTENTTTFLEVQS